MFRKKCYNSLHFIFLLCPIFQWNQVHATQSFVLKNPNIHTVLSDMPLGNADLMRYLRALESVIKFSTNYRKDLDFQYYFALFLVNESRQNLLRTNTSAYRAATAVCMACALLQLRSISIPARRLNSMNPLYNQKIWHIIETTEKLLKAYKEMVANEIQGVDDQNDIVDQPLPVISSSERAMLRFMDHSSQWLERIEPLNFDLLARDDPSMHKDLLFEYPDWSDYIKAISDYDEFSPSPLTSDTCLVSLDIGDFEAGDKKPKQCNILPSCEQMVLSGNTFGYYLTHRFMYMLLAHLGRGCYIFNPERDREMRKMLCAIMYVEASYIASNDFTLGDLMVEQMTFCALDGHAQFLRRSWIDNILTFQTDHGCFYIENDAVNRYRVAGCDLHTTALAASSLAAIVRYVVERNAEVKRLNDTYVGLKIDF